eukprot:CAMPEP_0185703062 /NCGR_PEP_ID=MMETSP1164-20130828/13543_1 /TAXON_ID=1104430 /ORGANISM="Chrysoreinhardia sp, Strain CCMP2950" /LENGTH=246 /DNA_ID=CAMNT_0028370329 /DNA_START=86 /DNA_END=826 /DNA_ORIENTATION=-
MADWGKFQRLSQRQLDAERAAVFPWASAADAPRFGVIEPDALLRLVRRRYREPPQQSSASSTDADAQTGTAHQGAAAESAATDEAFRALRAFHELFAALRVTSTCEMHGVRVQATSQYLGVNATTKARVFAYRVRIANVASASVVQLRSRHWVIADADGGSVVVPKGSPGVVGQTPRLAVGHHFEYVSGTELHAPRGSIRGSFEFVDDAGGVFEADVLPFDLISDEADADDASAARATTVEEEEEL